MCPPEAGPVAKAARLVRAMTDDDGGRRAEERRRRKVEESMVEEGGAEAVMWARRRRRLLEWTSEDSTPLVPSALTSPCPLLTPKNQKIS